MVREATVLVTKRRSEYLRIDARTILNRCSSERMPFAWTRRIAENGRRLHATRHTVAHRVVNICREALGC